MYPLVNYSEGVCKYICIIHMCVLLESVQGTNGSIGKVSDIKLTAYIDIVNII